MDCITYLLSNREFALIGAASGIHELYGFNMKMEECGREDIIYVLQKLTRKGCLKAEGERFIPTGDMADIFSAIRDADTTMEIHKKSGRMCILYIGSTSVCVTPSIRRTDIYEVKAMPFTEIWQYLLDEGWIYEPLRENPEDWL